MDDKTLLKSKNSTNYLQYRKFDLNLLPQMRIGPWCNGNTPVFGAVILGSSPSGPTKIPDLFKPGISF